MVFSPLSPPFTFFSRSEKGVRGNGAKEWMRGTLGHPYRKGVEGWVGGVGAHSIYPLCFHGIARALRTHSSSLLLRRTPLPWTLTSPATPASPGGTGTPTRRSRWDRTGSSSAWRRRWTRSGAGYRATDDLGENLVNVSPLRFSLRRVLARGGSIIAKKEDEKANTTTQR